VKFKAKIVYNDNEEGTIIGEGPSFTVTNVRVSSKLNPIEFKACIMKIISNLQLMDAKVLEVELEGE